MNLSETEAAVRSLLSAESNGFYRFLILEETGSTNSTAAKAAGEGAAEGLVVIAGKQTAGKGSRGRSFFSASPQGLYFSVVLRPEKLPPASAVKITAAAGVCVCTALERCGTAPAFIKWVNDVYMNGKKICGILTEGSFSADGRLQTVVCGVGINLAAPDGGFPAEIADTAGAAFSFHRQPKRNGSAPQCWQPYWKACAHSTFPCSVPEKPAAKRNTAAVRC